MPSEYQRKAWEQWGRRRNQGKMSNHPLYRRCRDVRRRVGVEPGYLDVKLWQPWYDDITEMIIWCDAHLGPFAKGESIDREDPFGDYVPWNLRKADASQQARNKRRQHLERLLAEDEQRADPGAGQYDDLPRVPAFVHEEAADPCPRHKGVCEQCPLRHGCEAFEDPTRSL